MATSGPWPPADVAGDFTLEESWALVALVECISPASPRRGLPSAADPAILRVILDAASKQAAELSSALRGFAGLARDDPHQACAAFRQRFPEAARTLQMLTAQGYYGDPRVMRALGMEARPPFPRGFELEQGDWTLLDPVRARPAF